MPCPYWARFLRSESTFSSFSPSVNPCPKYFPRNRISRESSLTSHESIDLGANLEQSDLRLSDSNDALEEDLVSLTQQLGVNETGDRTQEMMNDTPVTCYPNDTGTEVPVIDSVLRDETDAFNATAEKMDIVSESSRILADVEVCAYTEVHKSDGTSEIAFTSGNKSIADPKFLFASSSSAQGYAAARFSKKKNRQKVGADSLTVSPNLNAYATSSSQFYQLSAGTSLLSSPHPRPKQELAYAQNKVVNGSQINNEPVVKNESFSVAAVAAQESCESWRIRGNQAYASQDFSRAEEYYTNGVNSISQAEKSKSCCRVLMLCYSNRAAARMALGRLREALEDCMFASAIDPSFLKIQLRAANCYLALGEIGEASRYFKKILLSKGDVVEPKLQAEASGGIQKVQRVSQCINQSAELSLQGACPDADGILHELDEALSISPYSENLLEAKAEALFKLSKFEDVIQLSEQSFGPAEMNRPTLINNDQLPDPDTSVISKRYYFWLWRYRLIVNSCFQLGKLEQAVELLDKEASRKENRVLESSIPLASTIRELVSHKVAGNDAFQSGKYEEAIRHYTSALANSLDSRSFTATCYLDRAAAYKAVNQIADAISDCSLVMALNQNFTKAISRRASLFEMIRDYDQAAKDLRRLVSILKKNIEEKGRLSGTSDRSTNLGYANDLREAEVRLFEMEGEARKDTPLNLYLILGVEPLASPSDIRKAYRKSALKHHPDKAGQFLGKNDGGDDSLWKEMAKEVCRDIDKLFKMIGEAYAVLSDSSKRSRYDLQEEVRTAQKQGKGSSTSRTQTDFQNHAFERSGSGRQWTEVWRAYQQSKSQAQEASQSRWYT